jgi:TatD DNase family protein
VIDTHAHLDACEAPADELLARARTAGVERVITIGSGIDSCRSSLAIASEHDGVSAALGIHPHQAGSADAERLDELRELLYEERAVAVGEIGLDYYRDWAPRDRQRLLFERQLTLAAELRKPVVIHTRESDQDVLDTLAGFGGTVVLHCFSSPALLEPALERGYFVSFAGNVTFAKADELRAAAARMPDDLILAETDSPYLAPQPLRGKPNEPANVVHTLAAVAGVRGTTVRELAGRIDANASAAFGLPVPSPQ